MYAQGELSYLEAISAQTISQAISRYAELGMVQYSKSKSVKPIPLIALCPNYIPQFNKESGRLESSGRLLEFLERINSFRREGKDRRDAGEFIIQFIFTCCGRY